MINREAIYSALYDKLNTIQGFRTVSRRFKLWSELQPEQMPACMMVQAGEVGMQEGGTPTRWEMSVDILIYTFQADDTISPTPQLNSLLDAVEALFAPDDPASNRLTLGGLVTRAWLSGNVEIFEGVIANHSVAAIPVRILAN